MRTENRSPASRLRDPDLYLPAAAGQAADAIACLKPIPYIGRRLDAATSLPMFYGALAVTGPPVVDDADGTGR
ncbi:MAG: hypothetical protein QM809_09075 [Gordonia sp. (in: high G+C Gram-positive bacteria)]|uniref:hypothetical protein n=1 Tax=Gordonia sp. (in: high G+C Gram-positive bacteria) TaxID=84139 RepID=UPI0039E487B1